MNLVERALSVDSFSVCVRVFTLGRDGICWDVVSGGRPAYCTVALSALIMLDNCEVSRPNTVAVTNCHHLSGCENRSEEAGLFCRLWSLRLL